MSVLEIEPDGEELSAKVGEARRTASRPSYRARQTSAAGVEPHETLCKASF
jgi:hypothetical protein